MTRMGNFEIEWRGNGREAICPADPAYPDGVLVDLTNGMPGCLAELPEYPAPSCGYWVIECRRCGSRVSVTAAGRRDDPTSVRVVCLAAPT